MNNYLITSFDESYFNRFAVGWFGSLFDISNFNGRVIVVNFGYKNKSVIEKLERKGINFIHLENLSNKRYVVYNKISEIQKNDIGNYVYYDFDGYFNSDINSLFSECEKGIFLRAKNNNDGFVCGDNECWERFADFQKFERFCNFKQTNDYFILNDSDIKYISSKYNYIEPTRMNENTEVCFLHYTENFKHILNTNYDYDFSFAKKFPEINKLWSKEFEKKNITINRRFVFKHKKEN